MIKKSFLFLGISFLSQTFAVQEIARLEKMCIKAVNKIFIENRLDKASKQYINHLIIHQEMDPKLFDFTGKTIDDQDFSKMNLKGFNFIDAKIIKTNFKKCQLTHTIFRGTTFEDIDFRETDLKKVNFVNCKFIRCNLEKTDLSETGLEGCKFKKVQLNGARLYDGLEFNADLSHIKLVKLYAEFIKDGEKDKAKALNKIFGVLKLKLMGEYLNGLDLTDINLQKVDLKDAQLQGVRLSNTLRLHAYKSHRELILLYDHFIKNHESENAKTLNKILRNLHMHLNYSNLSNLNLRGINLRHAELFDCSLNNTNLTDANLKYTKLQTKLYCLDGMKLADDLIVSEDIIRKISSGTWIKDESNQALYQKLINAHVPIFDKVSYEHLKEIEWQKFDLRNANFGGIQLNKCNFENINLKNANFYQANLNQTIFVNANLKKADLRYSELCDANLTATNLNKTNLQDAKLKRAWLSEDLQLNYNEHPKELFKKWANNDEHRPLYQKLINARVPIIWEISEDELKEINWKGLNLKNSYIGHCKFNNITFKGVNLNDFVLDNVEFSHCKFKNGSLRYCNKNFPSSSDQKNIFIDSCTFSNWKFDIDFYTLRQIKRCNFVNIQTEIFKERDKKEKSRAEYGKMLLSLYSSLEDKSVHPILNNFFSNFRVWFMRELRKDLNLQELYLARANFRGANLFNSNFTKANLKESNFKGAKLIGSNLTGANLNGAKLFFDDITNKHWNNVKLSDDFVITQEYITSNITDLINILQSRGLIIKERRSDYYKYRMQKENEEEKRLQEIASQYSFLRDK